MFGGIRCGDCGAFYHASQASSHSCNPDAIAAHSMESWRKELANLESEASKWIADWSRSRAKEFQDWLKGQGKD